MATEELWLCILCDEIRTYNCISKHYYNNLYHYCKKFRLLCV